MSFFNQNTAGGTRTFTFSDVPTSLAQMKQLPEASLKDPFAVAALTILALCVYPKDKDASIEMLNFLKGPQPLSAYEIGFIRDRFMDSDYVPRSYLNGATPKNNYMPTEPLSITVFETAHSRDQEKDGYLVLYLNSGGADNPRSIKLRTKPSTGEWFLWEQFVLVGIRTPDAQNPWA